MNPVALLSRAAIVGFILAVICSLAIRNPQARTAIAKPVTHCPDCRDATSPVASVKE